MSVEVSNTIHMSGTLERSKTEVCTVDPSQISAHTHTQNYYKATANIYIVSTAIE